MKVTDTTPMLFGKYKGTPMANVPASYLVWLYDKGCYNPDVNTYLTLNISDLRKEAEKDRQK